MINLSKRIRWAEQVEYQMLGNLHFHDECKKRLEICCNLVLKPGQDNLNLFVCAFVF